MYLNTPLNVFAANDERNVVIDGSILFNTLISLLKTRPPSYIKYETHELQSKCALMTELHLCMYIIHRPLLHPLDQEKQSSLPTNR